MFASTSHEQYGQTEELESGQNSVALCSSLKFVRLMPPLGICCLVQRLVNKGNGRTTKRIKKKHLSVIVFLVSIIILQMMAVNNF